MSAFTFNPRADLAAVIDYSAINAAGSITGNLGSAAGSTLVGNDLIVATLDDFHMLPNLTRATVAPVAPLDRELWYDLTNHILNYYDLSTTTWIPVTTTAMKEILGISETGIISTNRTYTVPGDFATPLDVENYLRRFKIATGVTVTVNVSTAGTYNHATHMQGHPNGDQIHYIASGYTGGSPTNADFTATGYAPATIAANAAANTAMLNSKYNVKIACTGNGLKVVGANSIKMTDFLFVGPGRTVAGCRGVDIDSSAYLYGCSFVAFEVAVSVSGLLSFDAHLFANDCGSTGGAVIRSECGVIIVESTGVIGAYSSYGSGVYAGLAGTVYGYNVYGCGNEQTGINDNTGGSVFATVKMVGTFNGQNGATSATNASIANFIGGNSQFQNNGANGALATTGGRCQFYTPTSSGNSASGFAATVGGGMWLNTTVNSNNNTDNGILANSGGVIVTATGTTAKNNGISGLNANGGRIEAPNVATVPNTGTEIFATNGGYILCVTAVGAPTLSPAANTVGNFNSYIRN